MQVLNVQHVARWKLRKKSLSAQHRTTLLGYIASQLMHVSTIRRKLLSSNISSTSRGNMVNLGPLAAEIGWRVWGTPANFRCHSTEVNQTLHDVWLSPGLVHYIYIFGAVAPNGFLRGTKFTLRPSLALSYIGSVTPRHWSSGRQPNFAAWYLHATGRPSHSTLCSRSV